MPKSSNKYYGLDFNLLMKEEINKIEFLEREFVN